MMLNDLMENNEWFFNPHERNKDEYLTKDAVVTLSESFLVRPDENKFTSYALTLLQFIFRYEIGDAYLGAVS